MSAADTERGCLVLVSRLPGRTVSTLLLPWAERATRPSEGDAQPVKG